MSLVRTPYSAHLQSNLKNFGNDRERGKNGKCLLFEPTLFGVFGETVFGETANLLNRMMTFAATRQKFSEQFEDKLTL